MTVGDVYTLTARDSGGRSVLYSYDGSRTSSAAAVTGGSAALAGFINWEVTALNGSTYVGEMSTFCVEIAEGFPDDPIDYTVADLTSVPEETPPGNMSLNQSYMIQDLYNRYYVDVATQDGGAESFGDFTDEQAAFQLVIWEISHENFSSTTDLDAMKSELSISLGAMQITDSVSGGAAVLTAATNMISNLGTGGWWYSSDPWVFGGTNPDNQDLLIVVPSPAIAGLAGLGLAGMRRRRR
jgi:hypothetical protein